MEDAINIFQDVMQRASLSDYFHVNRSLLSKNDKDNSIIILVDQTLWNEIINIPDINQHISEIDVKNSDDLNMVNMCTYCSDPNNTWIELNCDDLYSGKVIKIKVDNFEYDLSVNKALIPLKLKKSEFNNISYRIFPDKMILALKKRFEYPLEDHGFSIVRLFQII
jgi:hypothetical protein